MRLSHYILLILFAGSNFSMKAQTAFFNGNASSSGANCYVITNPAISQRGSVWFSQQLNLNDSFDLKFTMNFGTNDAGGGDGMTFVLQRAGTSALGGTGGTLGYSAITPSLAVEFDTYQNAVFSDPVPDHIAVISNGVLNHAVATNIAGPVSALASQANIEDGLNHKIRIQWNPFSDSLNVYFDCEHRLAVRYNIRANIFSGNPMVWWGFTGSGGGAYNSQSVCIVPAPPVFIRDTTICRGNTIQLTAPPGNNYVWSPASGISNPTSASPLFFPASTTRYYVNYLDDCNHPLVDSVLITVSSVDINLGADTNLCYGNSVLLSANPGYLGYVWQNGTFGLTFTAGTSGIYAVAAVNTLGCFGYDSIRVNIMPPLSLSVTPGTPVICSGDSVAVTAAGAATYRWSPATGLSVATGTSITASPPSSTIYRLVATDAFGCRDSIPFSIQVNPLPTVVISNSATICAGSSAQLNASGGINYSWAPSSSLNNSLIANPVASPASTTAYSVNVTDANGCTNNGTVTVNVNPLPVINVRADTSVCIGSSVQLVASGGISYVWTPATGLNNPGIANPIASLTSSTPFTVTVTDSMGCSASAGTTVTINPLPVIISFPDTAVCLGSSIQLTASGGNTYSWSPSSTLNNAGISDPIATPAINTSYTVTVTDSNHCANTAHTNVVVHPNVQVILTPDQHICIGSGTQLNASGGITYSWSPATGISNPLIANPVATPVATTSYGVTVTDAFGCTGNGSVTVTVNPLPVVNMIADTSVCIGSTIQLFASGGISYAWQPATGLNNPNVANPVAAPSSSTTYSVAVTDTMGCSSSGNTTITVHTLPVVNVIPDTAMCSGSAIQLTASGGITYVWNPASALNNPNISNPIASPLNDISYTVTVTDANRCVNTAVSNVVVHPLVQVLLTPDQSICIGSGTQLNASGGTSYSWNPATGLSNPAIANPFANPVSAVSYVVTVMDSFGCRGSGSVTITVNPLPVVSISPDSSVCIGSTIQLVASGGISYAWLPANSLNNPNIPNPIVAPSSTTAYSVTVTDTLGCSSSAGTSITVHPLPVIRIIRDTAICMGSTIHLTASGGMNYSWSPSTSLDNANIANPVASPGSHTAYTVTVTDDHRCVNHAVVQIAVLPYVNVNIVPDQSICIGSNTQLSASGGTIYSWNPASGLDNPDISNPVAGPQSTTTYMVTVSALNMCPANGMVTITVNSLPVVTATNDTSIILGSTVQLVAEGGVDYLWYPDQYLDCNTCRHPLAAPMHDMNYFVAVTDHNGCTNRDSIMIKVEDIITLYIPNAFTPGNKDETNDILFAFGVGIKDFKFLIFDRWGKMIFETQDITKGWDGTYRGEPVQDGIYLYAATAGSFSGKIISQRGFINVVK